MTEAQRVGQLFLIGLVDDRLDAATVAAIATDHFGSVWFTAQTGSGAAAIRVVADAVQAQATAAATANVRFLVAANQEGGLIQSLRGPGFGTIPSALVQGGLDPAVLEADAARWGRGLRAGGINLNFAPVFDVVPPGSDAQNQPIGVLQREYGHDPATAGSHAAAFVRGMAAAGIATTAKHFPGLGRVLGNTDFSAGVVDDLTTSDDPYLGSFRSGIAAGVPFVMLALATYNQIDPGRLAAYSPIVIHLLREQLGFQGVIVSDSLGAAAAVAAEPIPEQRAEDFLVAGGDLIIPGPLPIATRMARAIVSRTSTDPAFAVRVNDAALRVLAAKEVLGLLRCG